MLRLKIVVDSSQSVWGPVFSTRNHVAPSDSREIEKAQWAVNYGIFFLGHFQKWSWVSLVAALTTTISKLEWYYLSFFILKCTFKRLTVLSIKKNLIGQFLVCSKNLWYWNSWGIIKFDFSECTMLCGGMIWIITKKSKEKTFFRKKTISLFCTFFASNWANMEGGGEGCSTFENIKQGMQSLEFRSWLLLLELHIFWAQEGIYFIFNVLLQIEITEFSCRLFIFDMSPNLFVRCC